MSTDPPPAHPPRPIWQWLLLLTPAVVMLTIFLILERLSQSADRVTELLLNLLTIPLLSLALGFWWVRGQQDWGARIGWGLLTALGIMVVNGLIAFAGCSLVLMK